MTLKYKWNWDLNQKENKGYYWNYEYRHFLRDITPKKRQQILNEFVKEKLKPHYKSNKHLTIIKQILNQK